jgi:hypothetical protein
MYILAGLLAVGFICNWLVKPVPEKLHMKEGPVPALRPAGAAVPAGAATQAGAAVYEPAINPAFIVLAWAAVWIPIAWGVYVTLTKAIVLFK